MYTHTEKPHREERAPWRGESVYGQPTAYGMSELPLTQTL